MKNGAIKRAIEVMRACADHPEGISFNELRRACGDLPAMALSRVMKPLVNEEIIAKNATSGLYQFGSGFLSLAQCALGALSSKDIVQPILNKLVHDTHESAAYFEWDGNWVVLLGKSEYRDSFHYADLNSRSHIIGNSFVQVCLAYLPSDIMEKAVQMHGDDVVEVKNILEPVRNETVWVNLDPIRGQVLRITAPVFKGPEGPIVGAIGISTLILSPDSDQLTRFKHHVEYAAHRATEKFSQLSI